MMEPAEIKFARCERGPPSASARRQGSKYLWQSHAAAQPPMNERMNKRVVMPNYSSPARPTFDLSLRWSTPGAFKAHQKNRVYRPRHTTAAMATIATSMMTPTISDSLSMRPAPAGT
jgi:hypothetical protein